MRALSVFRAGLLPYSFSSLALSLSFSLPLSPDLARRWRWCWLQSTVETKQLQEELSAMHREIDAHNKLYEGGAAKKQKKLEVGARQKGWVTMGRELEWGFGDGVKV